MFDSDPAAMRELVERGWCGCGCGHGHGEEWGVYGMGGGDLFLLLHGSIILEYDMIK